MGRRQPPGDSPRVAPAPHCPKGRPEQTFLPAPHRAGPCKVNTEHTQVALPCPRAHHAGRHADGTHTEATPV